MLSPLLYTLIAQPLSRLNAKTFFQLRISVSNPISFSHEAMQEINPNAELLDAPTFFALYRIYLQNHPLAAAGGIYMNEDTPFEKAPATDSVTTREE